jgi:uncharacterized metal-binding protein
MIMDMQAQNQDKPKYNMVFTCSGAADVGGISDITSRQLSREKIASMCCTAAIAARIPEIMEKTSGAEKILAIDGCSKNCTKIILEKEGFHLCQHLQLENMGMEKGKSPATEDRINTEIQAARAALL